MDSLEECLLYINLPFTLVKWVIVTVMTYVVYKPLSVLIKGRKEVR